jgi:hypothetical protein
MAVDAGSAGAIAAAVGVPLAMRALAWAFPAKETPASALSPEELKARYQKWEVAFALGMLAAAVPAGLGIWLLLRGVARAHAALLLPAADVRWVAGPSYWAIPAIFLAIAAMLPLFTALSRALLRERYAEYLAYQRVKSKMDAQRVANVLVTAVSIGCAAFIFLGLDWSVRLEPDALVVNRYLGVGEERFPLADVRAIRTAPALLAPNGNRVPRREFVVRLGDGRSWSTNNLLSDTSPEEKARLAGLVSARSGAATEEVDVLTGDDL